MPITLQGYCQRCGETTYTLLDELAILTSARELTLLLSCRRCAAVHNATISDGVLLGALLAEETLQIDLTDFSFADLDSQPQRANRHGLLAVLHSAESCQESAAGPPVMARVRRTLSRIAGWAANIARRCGTAAVFRGSPALALRIDLHR
jgi:hypothetical protein